MVARQGRKIDKEPARKHFHMISKRHDMMMSVRTPCLSQKLDDLRLDVDMLTQPKNKEGRLKKGGIQRGFKCIEIPYQHVHLGKKGHPI